MGGQLQRHYAVRSVSASHPPIPRRERRISFTKNLSRDGDLSPGPGPGPGLLSLSSLFSLLTTTRGRGSRKPPSFNCPPGFGCHMEQPNPGHCKSHCPTCHRALMAHLQWLRGLCLALLLLRPQAGRVIVDMASRFHKDGAVPLKQISFCVGCPTPEDEGSIGNF